MSKFSQPSNVCRRHKEPLFPDFSRADLSIKRDLSALRFMRHDSIKHFTFLGCGVDYFTHLETHFNFSKQRERNTRTARHGEDERRQTPTLRLPEKPFKIHESTAPPFRQPSSAHCSKAGVPFLPPGADAAGTSGSDPPEMEPSSRLGKPAERNAQMHP